MFDLECSNPALIPDAWSETDILFNGEREKLAAMKRRTGKEVAQLPGEQDFLRYFHECAVRQESQAVLPHLRRDYCPDIQDYKVMSRVAEQVKTPETLRGLAAHEHYEVRSAVAENENTPFAVLFALATDSHPDVRFRLAETHTTPIDILGHLLADDNPYVASRARNTIKRLTTAMSSVGRPVLSITSRQTPMRTGEKLAISREANEIRLNAVNH